MHNDSNSTDAPYEMSDANAIGIVAAGIVVFGFTAFTAFIGIYVLNWSTADRPAMTEYEKSPLAGEHEAWTSDARVQPDPAGDLAAHLSTAELSLHAYGTVSESPEVYHIPIDTAMEIIAHKGKLPTFKPLEAATGSTEH